MLSRKRVWLALNHKEPDRVPFDLGCGASCGISKIAYENLIWYLGLDIGKVNLSNLSSQTAAIDEVVFKKLGVDFRPIKLNKSSKWDLKIFESEDGYWFLDEWQSIRKMLKSNPLYYDVVSFPLAENDLDTYLWPDPTDKSRFEGIVNKAEDYIKSTDAALVFPSAMGNGFLQMGMQLFGFERWLVMLASGDKTADDFLERYLWFKISFWEAVLTRIGDKVDIVCESDDLGMQNGPWISLKMYRKHIRPKQQKLFSFIKSKTRAKIFLHSCGSVYDFIPDLIEVGLDILNPIQVSAAKMDTEVLKKEFGKDLVFWGGGIDTQRILPRGSKKQIEEEVKRRIDNLAPGGGFVFSAVHNIQSDVPPENIVTMIEALQKYGKY